MTPIETLKLDARWLAIKLPANENRSEKITKIIYSGEEECVWESYPPEFGAPYKLRFVDATGRTVRFGVGVFLPEFGGGWHIWGPNHQDCYFASYDPSKPLRFSGNPSQLFNSYLGNNTVKVELPEVYHMSVLHRAPGAIVFGEEKYLSGFITDKTQKHHNQVFTKYKGMTSTDEDTYSVYCPICGDGVLFMRRDSKTHTLLSHDNCVKCAQGFQFVDMGLEGTL